ncbi:type 2 lanthipeptide synthetase LanM [Polyangium sp. 15x6]|uniref:type 2 lanthipeptide synthetase LanM n=1 Tax=Polyangium sp. 15x6 TaxID=3042687 RepID=UPI00249A74FF|nr:type 2 lanthipeptide synthetase LanM [Polyangium sp. 15x6]MDI3288157.1 type 2 lanthipeptide synthetase LanM [Polyangium sp. 15x6]
MEPTATERRRAALLRIIARAAPPHERAHSGFFSPTPGQDRARREKLSYAFRQAIGAGEPGGFDAYLRAQGSNAAAFEEGLAEVTLRDPRVLPAWAHSLEAMLGLGPTEPGGEAPWAAALPRSAPYPEILAPLLREPALRLDEHIAAAKLDVAAPARQGMLSVLAYRLWRVLEPALDYEQRVAATNAGLLGMREAATPPPGADLDAWLDRLERFPVLAYLIGLSYAYWRGSMAEICERLAADRALLVERLFDGAEPGRLQSFRGDAGDVHGHGRAVALLGFEGGRALVYKPKDLRCAAAFMDLVAFLDGAGLSPELHVRRILVRGSHTWEEFIEHRPCENAGEVERFYTRMGMLIRLLQLLEGRDFWLDNLIAHGEHPAFIDLEMLVQPRVATGHLLPSEQEARRQLSESAVETCAIVMPTPIDVGVGTEDLGALAAPRPFLSPFKRSPSAAPRPGPPSERDYVTWTHPEHAPVLDGQPAVAARYLDRILEGYGRMQACLRENRTALLDPRGPLRGLRGAPVRFIHRDTWSYHKLIRRSLAPRLLADPFQRELFLQQLFQPALAATDDGRGASHPVIAHGEITALRELDVPLFTSRPSSDVVCTPAGDCITGYFDGHAWDRLVERLRTLDAFPLEQQLDIVRSCFSTGHEAAAAPPIGPPPARAEAAGWVEEAQQIAGAVLEDAITASTPDRAWLGLVYHPYIGHLSLGVLEADQLTGTGGLAILFADLYALTGQERWRTAARGALFATRKAADGTRAAFVDLERSGHARTIPPYCGGFMGTGAHLFCLRYCARALGDPELDRAADDCMSALQIEALLPRACADVACGMTGLLLAMLAAEQPGPAHALAPALASRLLAMCGASGELPQPPYPARDSSMARLPDPTAGLCMGLARLHERGYEGTDAQLLGALDGLHAAWRRQDRAPGSPGRLLAGLELARFGLGLDQALTEVDDALAQEPPAADTIALLDALEITSTAFELTGATHHRARAFALAEQLRALRTSTGAFFPASLAADRHHLSILWGLPAIARAFLRLQFPSRVPSLRLLRLPR